MKPLAAILGPQSEVGQTQLVKKVPSGQHFIFFDLRVWSKKVFGSRTRTRVFSTLEFSFFAGAGEYLLTTSLRQPHSAQQVYIARVGTNVIESRVNLDCVDMIASSEGFLQRRENSILFAESPLHPANSGVECPGDEIKLVKCCPTKVGRFSLNCDSATQPSLAFFRFGCMLCP